MAKMKQLIFLIFLCICLQLFCKTINAQSASSYNKSGVEIYLKGDYQGAIKDYNKAIELSSDTTGANAIKQFELSITLSQAYANRGNAKSQLKDYRGAIQDYTKAIEINPREYSQHTYYNRGIARCNKRR
jgi:tetratricopeptide (TPR) repeat protein